MGTTEKGKSAKNSGQLCPHPATTQLSNQNEYNLRYRGKLQNEDCKNAALYHMTFVDAVLIPVFYKILFLCQKYLH